MNFSFLPPKREDSEAAIAYVESLRGPLWSSDFEALSQLKSVVSFWSTAAFLCPVLLFFVFDISWWLLTVIGLFYLSSFYCSAYSNRLTDLLLVYADKSSYRRALRAFSEAEPTN